MIPLELCQMALAHLGEARITSLDDTTAAARACNLHYKPTRREVLRSHRWNFALARAVLTPPWMTVTGAASAGGLIQLTSPSHALATGARVAVRNVGGVPAASGAWSLTSTGANTFTLDGSVFSGSYTSGGQHAVIPLFGWGFRHALPEACLRVLEVNDSEAGDWISDEWVIEGREMLTNAERVNLVYVKDIGDEALSDPLFAKAFSLKLAAALTESLHGSTGKTAELLQQYDMRTAPLARRIDANEGRRRKGLLPISSPFIRARFTSP